ncbi:copia protein [Tanacetum coccineum]|uniref:Copia protein n=1 Tax=Tanacetum coccineum TaxID=301880 RepID=A0ABQ5CKX0_9ASTR
MKWFQHILSMLELHDATVSIEDANLKFLRSLPSVWHVVATMIRGQPGLDELDFDDLYNNLSVHANLEVPQAYFSTKYRWKLLSKDDKEDLNLSYSPLSRSSTTSTPHRPQRPKKVVKLIWVKTGSKPEKNSRNNAIIDSGSLEDDKDKDEATEDEAVLWHRRQAFQLSKIIIPSVMRGNLPKGFRFYTMNQATRKVQDFLHVNFLENQEKSKGNKEENYADSKEQEISCDDVEDMDDQQFIVHTTQPMPPEERTAAKEVTFIRDDELQQMVVFLYKLLFDAEERRSSRLQHLVDPTIDVPFYSRHLESKETILKVKLLAKQNRTNHKDQQTCLFACFLSQEEPNKVSQALADESWVEAIAEKNCFNSSYKRVVQGTLWPQHSSQSMDFEDLMQKEFKMSSMGELTFFLGLQVKQSNGGIFLSQDKYVKDILNKFDFRTIKPASTPIEAHKSLGKDEEGEDVDDTILPWSYDWMSSSAAASCCAQVLWMQNQLLDYGFNFMNTEIHIDNESTICIVKNPVFHSKTKHIQIRHHFIRDCYEQRLINVVKVHTDDNVADLLTKGFDLASSIYVLEVVTALAAEEAQVLVLIYGCKFSKGCFKKHSNSKCCSILKVSHSQSAAHSQRTASQYNATKFKEEDLAHLSLNDTADQDAVTPKLEKKKTSSPLRPIPSYETLKNNLKAAEVLVSIQDQEVMSNSWSQTISPQQPANSRERKGDVEGKAKRLLRKRKATIAEEQPSKKPKLRTETIDELRNYLRVVDFEKNAQDRESLEGISMITELQVIDSPDGEYLIIHRENNHFRAFDTLWEILHVLDRQDLYHLYRVVDDYYEHIPPTGLGLMLLGDLTIIWETAESSDDDFWKDQEEWEIIRWRFHESSGVHTLEIEDGTMIHMLAERRYPLSRELMIRMLEHGMEVEDESETAITLIHLFILWTTEDGDNS